MQIDAIDPEFMLGALGHRGPRRSKVGVLHLAASNWLADHGMPEPAASHAFAGGHADAAFDLVDNCLPEILA